MWSSFALAHSETPWNPRAWFTFFLLTMVFFGDFHLQTSQQNAECSQEYHCATEGCGIVLLLPHPGLRRQCTKLEPNYCRRPSWTGASQTDTRAALGVACLDLTKYRSGQSSSPPDLMIIVGNRWVQRTLYSAHYENWPRGVCFRPHHPVAVKQHSGLIKLCFLQRSALF